MIRYFFPLFALFILVRCSGVSTDILNTKKTWVYVELQVITSDTDNYYYFGQIHQKALDDIEANEGNRLFVLRNVRYYDDFDKLQAYADATDDGTLFFRTTDIVKIEILKHDPLYGSVKDTVNIDKKSK